VVTSANDISNASRNDMMHCGRPIEGELVSADQPRTCKNGYPIDAPFGGIAMHAMPRVCAIRVARAAACC
jgi:hypothetical protein